MGSKCSADNIKSSGQESSVTVRCYAKATVLIAPRWASAKAICIATHFGTSPSLAEQNHRELPSIPIIIKANISHPRHAGRYGAYKASAQLAIKKRCARLFADTEEMQHLQWSISATTRNQSC